MNTTINSDLIRGNINTIILKALYEGDRYGYDIIKEIEQKSSGQYVLKQPTLYSCLKRLEVQGFIRSYWGAKSNGGRRKYYTLTDMGRELFLKNQTEWEYSRTVIDRLISDREADLSNAEHAYAVNQSLEVGTEALSHGSTETEQSELYDDSDFDAPEEEFFEDSYTLVEATEYIQSEIDKPKEAESLNKQSESEEEPELSASELELLDGFEPKNESTDTFDDESEPDLEEIKACYKTAKSNSNLSELADEGPESDPQEQAREYTDTSKLLDKLFLQQAEDSDDSYAEKLASDSYEAIPQKKSQEPQPDFEDWQDHDEDTDSEESALYDDTSTVPALPIQNPPAPQESDSGFLRYDTVIEPVEDEKHSIVKRDYKNALGRLVANQSTAVPDAAPVENAPAVIPLSKEMTLAEEATTKLLNPEKKTAQTLPSAGRKYSDLSIPFRELGDNIYVREHSLSAAREHESKLYYHPYRLMRVQYAILFGMMILMIAITFLIARFGFGILYPRDIWVYAFAITLAAVLPLISAILHFRHPDKKARIQYNFKTSLIYRLILFVGCLVLIYCVNIYLGMSPAFSVDYLCPLLLPFLFSLCLPINTIIFNSLFNSGKYSA